MRLALVVEPNPVTDDPIGMLQSFNPLTMNALLLEGSDDALDHTVLLRAVRRDELLLETIASDQSGEASAGEYQTVASINKGKARTPYEFGAKVSIATGVQGNLVVGVRAFGGNPFDRYTLAEQLEQTTILLQDRGIKPGTVYVDLGYRGVDHDNTGVQINHRSKKRRLNEAELRLLKRRQSIEPVIGHLKGEIGDRIHAVLCAAGNNIRWLLRMIVKKGLGLFCALYLDRSITRCGGC